MAVTEKELDELSQIHAIIKELHEYEKAFDEQKIIFFRPNPQGDQSKFFHASTAVVRLVLGSNRSGKTACGAVEAIAHMLGYRPWLSEDHPDRIVRLPGGEPIPVPNVGKVLAQNFEQAVRQTIIPKFEEWCPRAFIKRIEKNTRGIPVSIELVNGSIAYFMSNDQDDMAFEGPNHHWVWVDEPCDYRKYTGLKRGLVDYNGHIWMTMTPLSQPWINDTIASKAGDPDGNVKMFKFSIWDNCDEVGGHLKREAIEAFLSDLKEDELEARLHGNFLHLAGLVYKSWRPESPFFVDPFDIPLSWPRVQLTDPHTAKPLAIMWAAVSPTNTWYIYRSEFNPAHRTVKLASNYIKRSEGWYHDKDRDTYHHSEDCEPIALRIIDWSAEENDLTSGMSVRKKFTEEGLPHVKAKKSNAAYGYDAIHESLTCKYEWDTPRIVVFNTCPEVKQNFMNFCYDGWASGKMEQLRGPKEGYRPVHDDFIDLIRYIFQHKLSFHVLRRVKNQQERHQSRLADLDELEGSGQIFLNDGTRTGYGVKHG